MAFSNSPLFVFLLIFQTTALWAQHIRPETGSEYNWNELRAMDEFDYDNRWDDLTLLKLSYWMTPREIQSTLQIQEPTHQEIKENICTFQFSKNDQILPLFSLTMKVLGKVEMKSQKEKILQTNKTLEQPAIKIAISDVDIFMDKEQHLMYVFPQEGIAFWLLKIYEIPPSLMSKYQDKSSPKASLGLDILKSILYKYDSML
ncbi:hypothetical protein AAG747_25890 [Rapidithrix thailandica]|uniref:Uncharacterized protein n=1 Tax=Rapidithrix thailandica TaxID=413964 RepID=A0AAW9SGB6_9BACT